MGALRWTLLLTTIVLWLSINFNLPGTFELPKVEFVRPIEIAFFRYQAFTAEAQRQCWRCRRPTLRRPGTARWSPPMTRGETGFCCPRLDGPDTGGSISGRPRDGASSAEQGRSNLRLRRGTRETRLMRRRKSGLACSGGRSRAISRSTPHAEGEARPVASDWTPIGSGRA